MGARDRGRWAGAMILAGVLGCGPGPAAEGEGQPEAAPAADGSSVELGAHMKDHFGRAELMRQAVIAGDLKAVKEPAAWLGEHDMSSTLPRAWLPQIVAFQAAARRAAGAEDLDAAARAIGDLGRACAACHAELGGPALTPRAAPAPASGAASHMARHQWAAEEMWRGLMAPSDEVWTLGSEALADAPLRDAAAGPEVAAPPEILELAERVHELGAEAHATADRVERARIYGELVGTCAACHTAVRKGPPSE